MNLAIVSGRIRGESQMSYTPNGLAILKLTVVTTKIDKNGEDKETEVDITFFGDRAEEYAAIETDGIVVVSGMISTRESERKTGVTFRNTDFIGFNIEY